MTLAKLAHTHPSYAADVERGKLSCATEYPQVGSGAARVSQQIVSEVLTREAIAVKVKEFAPAQLILE